MSDYTPTIKEIRDRWGQLPYLQAAFDRALEAHDAEVRAAVLAEQGEPEDYWVYDADGEFWAGSTSLNDAWHYLAQEPGGWIEAVYHRRLPVEDPS